MDLFKRKVAVSHRDGCWLKGRFLCPQHRQMQVWRINPAFQHTLKDVWCPLDRVLKQQWMGKKDFQELKVNRWWEVSIPVSESPWLACIFWGHWFHRHLWHSPLKKSLHKMFYSTLENPSTQTQWACFSEMLNIQKIPVKLSRPEDASHLWKYQIYHRWLRSGLTQKLSVTDLNII